jgi:hypothetical protein
MLAYLALVVKAKVIILNSSNTRCATSGTGDDLISRAPDSPSGLRVAQSFIFCLLFFSSFYPFFLQYLFNGKINYYMNLVDTILSIKHVDMLIILFTNIPGIFLDESILYIYYNNLIIANCI